MYTRRKRGFSKWFELLAVLMCSLFALYMLIAFIVLFVRKIAGWFGVDPEPSRQIAMGAGVAIFAAVLLLNIVVCIWSFFRPKSVEAAKPESPEASVASVYDDDDELFAGITKEERTRLARLRAYRKARPAPAPEPPPRLAPIEVDLPPPYISGEDTVLDVCCRAIAMELARRSPEGLTSSGYVTAPGLEKHPDLKAAWQQAHAEAEARASLPDRDPETWRRKVLEIVAAAFAARGIGLRIVSRAGNEAGKTTYATAQFNIAGRERFLFIWLAPKARALTFDLRMAHVEASPFSDDELDELSAGGDDILLHASFVRGVIVGRCGIYVDAAFSAASVDDALTRLIALAERVIGALREKRGAAVDAPTRHPRPSRDTQRSTLTIFGKPVYTTGDDERYSQEELARRRHRAAFEVFQKAMARVGPPPRGHPGGIGAVGRAESEED